VYGVGELDLGWVPASVPVVVVHNDGRLRSSGDPRTIDIHPGRNVGFGAGINAALRACQQARRLVVVNPDTRLRPEHWAALTAAAPHETIVIPLVDATGRATSVVSRFPTPLATVLTALRAGRLAPRGSRRRRIGARLLGRWGTAHVEGMAARPGTYPAAWWWASGAAFSIDRLRLEAVGGFDEGYFLYFEDTDLGRRIGRTFPDHVVRLARVQPGIHAVGGTAVEAADRHAARCARVASAARYASGEQGWRWRAAAAVLTLSASRARQPKRTAR